MRFLSQLYYLFAYILITINNNCQVVTHAAITENTSVHCTPRMVACAATVSLEVGVYVKLGHVCQRHLFHWKLEYMSNWAMYASATSFTGSWSTCQTEPCMPAPPLSREVGVHVKTGPCMPAPPLSREVGVHVKLSHVCQRHLFHWKLEYMSNWAMYASATSFTGSWSTC